MISPTHDHLSPSPFSSSLSPLFPSLGSIALIFTFMRSCFLHHIPFISPSLSYIHCFVSSVRSRFVCSLHRILGLSVSVCRFYVQLSLYWMSSFSFLIPQWSPVFHPSRYPDMDGANCVIIMLLTERLCRPCLNVDVVGRSNIADSESMHFM